MNWNTIEKSWNEFAEINNSELIYDERNLFHTTECKYKVHFQAEYGPSFFSGILWKSQDGHNRNQTKIATKFNTDESLHNFELENGALKNFFSKNKLNEFEKDIAQDLKELNGKNLSLKGNVLNIELNRIISSKSEFNKATELIKKIRTYRKQPQ